MAAVSTLRAFVSYALFLGALGACERGIDDPTPPDTTILEASYDAPPGRLNAQTLPGAAANFFSQIATVETTQRFRMLNDIFQGTTAASRRVLGTSLDSTIDPTLLVVANATRTCRGAGDDTALPPIDPDAGPSGPGNITLTVKGSRHGIYPIVWGSFADCVQHIGSLDIRLDGEFSMTMQDSPLGRTFLYSFTGVVETGQGKQELNIDFRLFANGTLEVRVPTANGDVVMGVDPQGQQSARDRNGLWTCQLLQPRCANASNGEVLTGATAQP